MKPTISPNGVLRLSTVALLASLAACGSGELEVNRSPMPGENQDSAPIDPKEVELVKSIEAQAAKFASGKIDNNYHHDGLGYYHAAVNRFHEHPYNQEKDGQWYVNGTWQTAKGPEPVEPSAPDAATLAALEQSLRESEVVAAPASGTGGTTGTGNHYTHHHHGSGWSNALLAYWILRGNSHRYTPTDPGFMARRGAQVQNDFQQAKARTTSRFATGASTPRPVTTSSGNSDGTTKRGLFGSSSRPSSSSGS